MNSLSRGSRPGKIRKNVSKGATRACRASRSSRSSSNSLNMKPPKSVMKNRATVEKNSVRWRNFGMKGGSGSGASCEPSARGGRWGTPSVRDMRVTASSIAA